MKNSSEKSKSRNLSIFEFFEILQLEYMTAELRKRIYPKPADKRYYTKVMSFKKDKIADIASRNTLPSIFNSVEEKRNLYRKFYNEKGLPNFVYRNDQDEEKFAPQDREHYYSQGAEVKVHTDEGIIVGEIYEVNFSKSIIFVKPRGEEESKPHSISNITRII